jgi:endonuclease YncB( thermonuclease family)
VSFPTDVYTRWFTVTEVHDGDTVMGILDLGFRVSMAASCRLAGMNARELSMPGGQEARQHLADLVGIGPIPKTIRLSVSSVAIDKFAGRFDALLWLPSGESASAVMIRDGYAVAWDGKGAKPVPPWPLVVAERRTGDV